MSRTILKQLPYHRDSAQLLCCLQSLPGLSMLDSGLRDQAEARFDIISALPARSISLYPDHLCLAADDGSRQYLPADTDIFELLRQETGRLGMPDAELEELPFRGGSLFCLGYESRRDLIPFRQRGEQEVLAWAGIHDWAIVVDHQLQRSLLFFLPECPPQRRRLVTALLAAAPAPAPAFRLAGTFRPAMSRQDYLAAFQRLQSLIHAGDCYQANLAQCFEAEFDGDALGAYLALRKHSHSPFSAFFRHPHDPAIATLSLSPERFLSVSNGEVVTQPIKGTRPRDENPARDSDLARALQDSDKDRAENLMIVDLLRNDLGRVCQTGSVRTPDLFRLESFTSVHHLISTVTGTLDHPQQSADLLRACFPGGSITGAPKIRAMQIIDELENRGRSIYCGSIGYLNTDGDMDCNITIRSLLCDQERISCWGGGGIVADSDPDQEYAESINKISLLISTLENKDNTAS